MFTTPQSLLPPMILVLYSSKEKLSVNVPSYRQKNLTQETCLNSLFYRFDVGICNLLILKILLCFFLKEFRQMDFSVQHSEGLIICCCPNITYAWLRFPIIHNLSHTCGILILVKHNFAILKIYFVLSFFFIILICCYF